MLYIVFCILYQDNYADHSGVLPSFRADAREPRSWEEVRYRRGTSSHPWDRRTLGRSRSGQVLDAEMHLSTSPKLPPLPRQKMGLPSCHACNTRTAEPGWFRGHRAGGGDVVNFGTPNRLYQREEQGSAAIHCLSRTAGKPELEARGVEFKARNNGPGLDSRERGVCHSCRQSQLSWCPREQ